MSYDNVLEQFIQSLLEQLGEPNNEEFTQKVRLMVNKRGPKIATLAYNLAVERYESGDMISDGSRQRTLGGCFVMSWKQARQIVNGSQPSA